MVCKIVVTGCAGFIGSHTCEYLLSQGHEILGIDNLNHYYQVERKKENLKILEAFPNFQFKKQDIVTSQEILSFKPEKICHLAAMAGVRNSLENPIEYVNNITAFINILEQARQVGVKQIVYASSSSVYGRNQKVPFRETDTINSPNSPYAASKIAMETYAQTYHQLYQLNLIGLRFFTVYGPRGRPDMAPYKFIKAISEGTPIEKYGYGLSARDYTYISDIVSGIVKALDNPKQVKHEIYNLGNSSPISLNNFIETCEQVVGKKAIIHQIEDQLGDVPKTYADIGKAYRDLDYHPQIGLLKGLSDVYQEILNDDKKT